jgi:hypothetical protein
VADAWAAAPGGDTGLIRQLKVISAIGGERRRSEAAPAPTWLHLIDTAFTVVIGIAVLQVAVSAAYLPAWLARDTFDFPFVFFVLTLYFGGAGVVLLAGGARDARLPLLGTLFLMFSGDFIHGAAPEWRGTTVELLQGLPPDGFIPFALWRFVWAFPSDVPTGPARRLGAIALCAAAAWGFVVLLGNAVHVYVHLSERAHEILHLVQRDRWASLYTPVIVVLVAVAIPFLIWRARQDTHENRRRATLFAVALGMGLAPLFLGMIIILAVPAFSAARSNRWVAVLVYTALATIVPTTAYAVAVQRVMHLQFLVRTALQYALARSAIWAAVVGPLAYLTFDLYANRDLAISQYVERGQPALIVSLSTVAFVALTFRQQAVTAVDRWFLRERVDHADRLARLERELRHADSLRRMSAVLASELRGALHASVVSVMLDRDDGRLVCLDGQLAPLARESTLLDMLRSLRRHIQLDLDDAGSIARLLPPDDREWLARTGVRLLAPLRGSTGAFLGVVAVGESRSRLPYADAHYQLVTAAAAHTAMHIENRSLRAGGPDRNVDWENERAAVCPSCLRVASPDTPSCCGVATATAALPAVVNGKFRLERQIGTGGNGVVYLATDLVLSRPVAIKTLPAMGGERAARLNREARAMASALHPNLALIYGAEQWNGIPMLIEEYLERGTLHDRLRRGPLAPEDAIDLGIVLADALDCLHASGVLHCDVKPSNIGYTADGRPKLLDFGLAEILNRTRVEEPLQAASGSVMADLLAAAVHPEATVTISRRIIGTPLYMSPEALAGAAPAPASDLWGLSMVLYEAIAGRHPFRAATLASVIAAARQGAVPDIREHRPEFPASLAAFLHNALSPVPDRRPQSAAAACRQLQALRDGLSHAH